MIARAPRKDIRHRTDRAPPIRVILPCACIPYVPAVDVDLAGGVGEAEESAGEDGHGVLLHHEGDSLVHRAGKGGRGEGRDEPSC